MTVDRWWIFEVEHEVGRRLKPCSELSTLAHEGFLIDLHHAGTPSQQQITGDVLASLWLHNHLGETVGLLIHQSRTLIVTKDETAVKVGMALSLYPAWHVEREVAEPNDH